MRASVLIPTFRRPESFLRAARSVFAQEGADFELIAIDNSPEGSALEAFQTLEAEAPIPFRHAHAGEPGVAHARNAALKLARGRYVAWLDDDEEAAPGWLAALIRVREETGAQSVFGPVAAKTPPATPHADFFEALYARAGAPYSGPISGAFGIGNSLQPRAMYDEAAPFDAAANETGGEDDRLFSSWAEAGARFAWAHDALVTEHLEPARLTLAYGLKRAFAYGQGPCETAWAQRDYASLARHMGVGAAQAAAYGAGAVLSLPAPRRALKLAGRAARGAGKVLWFRPQRFYGTALARQTA
ncbi:MAG TPA: glycosyltransferase family 2 protein [Terricaulis sp.]|nr:glycosyltransferase family 2 protein [Terricaulis sp.]